MKKRLRGQIRSLAKSPGGKRSLGFGLRVGYWPCLSAPYVSLTFLFWRIEGWFGFASYKKGRDEQAFLRRIVDIAWMEALEDQSVPSTAWADRMIANARAAAR